MQSYERELTFEDCTFLPGGTTVDVLALMAERDHYRETLERILRAGVCSESCTTEHVTWCPQRIADEVLREYPV